MKLTTTRKIGATDASKLLGLSKYGGPREVYDRIVLGIDAKVNSRMQRGTKYEPEVRRRYVEQTGAELSLWVMPLICEHPLYPWATCSPDDITVDDVLCEYKTTSRYAKGWEPIPQDYAIQCSWSLWVTGLNEAHLYAAFGVDGDKTRPGEFFIDHCQLYVIKKDPELFDTFADVGERFWRECVETKTPPREGWS